MSPLKRRRDEIIDETFAHEVVKPSSTLTTAASSNHVLSGTPGHYGDYDTTSSTAATKNMKIQTAGSDLLPVDMLNDEACFSPIHYDHSDDNDNHSFPREEQEKPSPEQENREREIFHKARHYLNPGPILRYAIYLFGERKLFTLFCVHFVCTVVIWGTCALYLSFVNCITAS